jgi:hypothetical protein
MDDFASLMQKGFSKKINLEQILLLTSLVQNHDFSSCALQNLQVQRQFAVRGSPEAEQLDAMQADLLNRLQQDALQFQELQARLQLRVLQVQLKRIPIESIN